MKTFNILSSRPMIKVVCKTIYDEVYSIEDNEVITHERTERFVQVRGCKRHLITEEIFRAYSMVYTPKYIIEYTYRRV